MLDKCKLSLRSDYSNFDIILKPSDFDSVISKSIVTNLIASYEQERLRFEIFYVNSIITDKKVPIFIFSIILINACPIINENRLKIE